MKASTRYGLVGIGALSLLSIVHWLRNITEWRRPAGDYLLGVSPNFAAAIAISFVLLSIWADQKHDASFVVAARAFIVCVLISGLGLIGSSSRRPAASLSSTLMTLVRPSSA